MKKILLLVVAVAATIFSANAQVKIESPHPDIDIQIKRCAYASGTVVIDMVITNYGMDEKVTVCNEWYNDYPHIEAYDDEGNFYTRQVGEMKVGLTNVGLNSRSCDIPLSQDVPLKFRVELSKISANANKIVLIKIPLTSKGAMSLDKNKPLIIRNLEWSK